jgi:hypothetical protein
VDEIERILPRQGRVLIHAASEPPEVPPAEGTA